MKNARIFLLIVLFLALKFVAQAQSYRTAFGVRVDNGFNLTLQQYVGNKWTVEGILHAPFRSQEIGLTGLAERHHKILFRALNVYYGAGAHYYWQTAQSRDQDSVTDNVYGLSFIGGAELSIGRLNFSVDVKPELHLGGDQIHPFEWPGTAVSVRYVLAKRHRKTVRDWGVWDKFPKRKKSGKR